MGSGNNTRIDLFKSLMFTDKHCGYMRDVLLSVISKCDDSMFP